MTGTRIPCAAVRRSGLAVRRLRAWGPFVTGLFVAVASPSIAGPALESSVEPNSASYVLRFDAGATRHQRAVALAAVGARRVVELEPLRLAKAELQPPDVAALEESGIVEWIHREGMSYVATLHPNDPLLDRQWALEKTRAFRGWGVVAGGMADPVVVAVVDTGVDPSHPDLQGRLLDGVDFVNADRDPADDHGHGTHVAGIIAARAGNDKGIAGLSWGARVLPLKACDVSGACSNFPVVQAIVWAVQNGAKIVNLSLGGPAEACPREFDVAMDFAERHGVMLVAAAGNSGERGGDNPVNYPAGCEGYVGVGATGPSDEWAPFSTHNQHVDLSAPGMQVLSTLPPGSTMEDDPTTHGYGPADGTSMAAPYVAGLAALLFAQHAAWSPTEVQQRMESTSVDLGKKGRDSFFGAGRIDVAAALGADR